ncbi:MAG: DUF2244 domain-containing protein [Burkholderiales bacterium]
MSSETVSPLALELSSRQNRSLTLNGKLFVLTLLACNLLAVGLWFTFIGAWLVLPYAGLEFLLVWWAFKLVSLRADDYEKLTVADLVVAFESRIRGTRSNFECNAKWAQIYCLTRYNGKHCELSLRYAGRQVPVGSLLSDEQRFRWANALQGKLKVVRAAM